ncbi:hypothetical protein E1171_03970 [Cytophagales bacterium RKSG123]|nr:hypothetical protein [Xanthovirga aplysinae]
MRLFMIPEGIFESDSSKAKIKINWGEIPNDGLFHSSFGIEKKQNFEVNREGLYASFFVGGDFRRASFKHDNDTIYFVTRGNWKFFKEQDVFNILRETINAQYGFWNDPRKGNFSVTLLPTYEPWTKTSKANSIGSSGFSSSFISFASNNEGTNLNKMRWLYNHELLHKWIGRTIINENEVEQYWFSEGFTDYYSYKLMLKNDNINALEFIDIINKEVIIPHYKDPVNNIPNYELTFEEYWNHYDKYMKLPYRRGFLYAFLIDNQIKGQNDYSKSLDDLMHDLFEMALNDKKMKFNQKLFVQLLKKYLKHDNWESDFKQYILEGQLIDYQEELPNGLSIDYQDGIPVFKVASENSSELGKKLKL